MKAATSGWSSRRARAISVSRSSRPTPRRRAPVSSSLWRAPGHRRPGPCHGRLEPGHGGGFITGLPRPACGPFPRALARSVPGTQFPDAQGVPVSEVLLGVQLWQTSHRGPRRIRPRRPESSSLRIGGAVSLLGRLGRAVPTVSPRSRVAASRAALVRRCASWSPPCSTSQSAECWSSSEACWSRSLCV